MALAPWIFRMMIRSIRLLLLPTPPSFGFTRRHGFGASWLMNAGTCPAALHHSTQEPHRSSISTLCLHNYVLPKPLAAEPPCTSCEGPKWRTFLHQQESFYDPFFLTKHPHAPYSSRRLRCLTFCRVELRGYHALCCMQDLLVHNNHIRVKRQNG